MERSGLGANADGVPGDRQPGRRQVNPLLRRLATREVERVSLFARQLPAGSEIDYDGEDREWLLGLTQEAQASIDAISLSTVDAGVLGLDGGLWTSDLGIRYLEVQRKAIARQVRIRRIFVFERAEDLAQDESFQRVAGMQRNAGVQVRMLDQKLIPDWLRSTIFDFIMFDGLSVTRRRQSRSSPQTSRGRARCGPGWHQIRSWVRDLEQRFEHLWRVADPSARSTTIEPKHAASGPDRRLPAWRTRSGSGRPTRLAVCIESRAARPVASAKTPRSLRELAEDGPDRQFDRQEPGRQDRERRVGGEGGRLCV